MRGIEGGFRCHDASQEYLQLGDERSNEFVWNVILLLGLNIPFAVAAGKSTSVSTPALSVQIGQLYSVSLAAFLGRMTARGPTIVTWMDIPNTKSR